MQWSHSGYYLWINWGLWDASGKSPHYLLHHFSWKPQEKAKVPQILPIQVWPIWSSQLILPFPVPHSSKGKPSQKLWHPWPEHGLYFGLFCLKMLLSVLFSSAFPGIHGEKKSQERVNGGPASKVYNPESNSRPESGRVIGVKIYKFNCNVQAHAFSFFLHCLKRLSCSLPLFQPSKSHVTLGHLSTVPEKLNFPF